MRIFSYFPLQDSKNASFNSISGNLISSQFWICQDRSFRLDILINNFIWLCNLLCIFKYVGRGAVINFFILYDLFFVNFRIIFFFILLSIVRWRMVHYELYPKQGSIILLIRQQVNGRASKLHQKSLRKCIWCCRKVQQLNGQILFINKYRMSVSLSSVYEQTESLKQIQQVFDNAVKDQAQFESQVKEVVSHASNLTMSEAYRFAVILSKYLTSNTSVMRKYAALYAIKQLLLTAYHHFYIFVSVRALSWISNMARFQSRKTEYERAKSYLKQVSLKGNGDEVLQERNCYKLFKLVDQFLPWFSDNIPTHINAEYEFRSTFVRALQETPNKKSITNFQNFSQQDFSKFEYNFNTHRAENRQLIRQLGQFISLQTRSLVDQQKYKSELLKQIVRTSDSHCIKAIVSELCLLLEDSSKLFCCLKITENLMNVGEIQFAQLTNLYIVPMLLNYVLPIDFTQGKKLARPLYNSTLSQEKCIIDCIHIWRKISEKMGISVQFYNQVISQMERQKKPGFNVQQKHLADFLTNVIDMEGVNSDKKQYLHSQNVEKKLILILNAKGDEQIVKQTPQYKLDTSAINQLNDFKQSQVRKVGKGSDQSAGSGIFNFNFQSFGINKNMAVGSNKYLQSPKRGLTVVGNPQQIVTFKNTQTLNNIKPQVKSPFKNSIQIDPSLKVIEQQSGFMAFNASNLSKFSEYSVKKSKEQLMNYNQILSPKLSSPKQILSPSSSQIGNSKLNQLSKSSESVVYFGKSQDFQSENSIQNQKPQKKEDRQRQSFIASQKSLKLNQLNQQNASTYKFDSSSFSNSSGNSSGIKNFGKDNQHFPQTVPKPTFGFKKKIGAEVNANGQEYYDNILANSQFNINQNSQLKKSNGKGEYYQFRDSLHSQIEDLSGGMHKLQQSIQVLSQKGDHHQIRSKIYVKSKKNDQNNLKISPNAQYYETNYFTKQNMNQVSRGKPYPAQLNEPQNRLRKINSQKHLGVGNQFKEGKRDHQLEDFNGVKSSKQIEIQSRKKPIIIDQFANDRLLGLQKQLGKAIQQKNRKQTQLRKRQSEYKLLKSKSIPYMGKKMELLKKENEIIKLLVGQKNKEDYGVKVVDIVKPIKNQNKMSDYFLQNEVSGVISLPKKSYDRAFTKQILGSRCLLLANEYLQLGYNYSQRQNQVSLYLTFYKIFDFIHIKVNQNTLMLEKPVDVGLQNQPAGYQLKIKRKVKGIVQSKKQLNFSDIINQKSSASYTFPQIVIKISDEEEEQQSFKVRIPCSILNLAQPMEIDMEEIQQLKGRKVVSSNSLPLSSEFAKNYKQRIQKYFPTHMKLVDGWYLVGFSFPQTIFTTQESQYVKFKITNSKNVEFQFFNDPKSLLAQSLVNVMTSSSQ